MIRLPKIGLSGHYVVGVIRSTGEYESLAEFPNLITDAGLNAMVSSTTATLTQYCRAGSGATAPANGQTTLVSPLGSSSAAGTNVITTSGGSPAWFQTMTRVYTFSVGAVVGNVAELGIFNTTSGGVMFSRALVKDGAGDPTTISVAADEQLVVTYALRIYPPADDITGTISATINGSPSDIDYVIRAANVDNANTIWDARQGPLLGIAESLNTVRETDVLGLITSGPAGAGTGANSISSPPYVSGSFYRDVSVVYNVNTANFTTGIGSLAFAPGIASASPCFQMSFDPKIPKDNLETLTITYRISWGRYVA